MEKEILSIDSDIEKSLTGVLSKEKKWIING